MHDMFFFFNILSKLHVFDRLPVLSRRSLRPRWPLYDNNYLGVVSVNTLIRPDKRTGTTSESTTLQANEWSDVSGEAPYFFFS